MVRWALVRVWSSTFPHGLWHCPAHGTGLFASHGKRGWVPDQMGESLTKLVFHSSCVSTPEWLLTPGTSEKSRQSSPVLLAGESAKLREADLAFPSQTSPLPPVGHSPCHTGEQGTADLVGGWDCAWPMGYSSPREWMGIVLISFCIICPVTDGLYIIFL